MKWRALDSETWLIAAGYTAPHPVSIAWSTTGVEDTQNVTLRLWSDPLLLAELRAVLAEGIVGINIAFDMGVLCQWFPSLRPDIWRAYSEGRILDASIACMLADVAQDTVQQSYSLENCAARHLGVAVDKGGDTWRLRYRELTDIPIDKWPQAAVDYAKNDVTHTAELWNKIGFQPTLDFECRAAWALNLSASWGMRTHGPSVDLLEKSLAATMAQRNDTLYLYEIIKPDGTKNATLIRSMVVEELGTDAKKTPSGKVSTDKDALALCQQPALRALADAGTTATIQSTFLPVLKTGVTYPINPRYNPVMRSDRVSCEKPNLENLPRKGGVRECFVPRAGYVFASVDYSGAELVCLAQVLLYLFGASAMADAILRGEDLHIKTAAMLLHRGYEQTLQDYRAGDKAASDTRQLAKALNFGIPGGLAPKTLRTYLLGYGIRVTLAEATEYHNRWLALYPEMAQYFAMIKEATRRSLISIDHPLTGFVRGGVGYCQAANHYFQSLLAKIAKEALWRAQRECYGADVTALTGSRIVVFVHDEIIIEAPVAVASEAADRLAEVMRVAGTIWMKDLPITAEPHLMTCWSKSARVIRDGNGRLVAWSPPLQVPQA